jgi:hypothetical protein
MKDAQNAGDDLDGWNIDEWNIDEWNVEKLERRENCAEPPPIPNGSPRKREPVLSWPGHPSLEMPEE